MTSLLIQHTSQMIPGWGIVRIMFQHITQTGFCLVQPPLFFQYNTQVIPSLNLASRRTHGLAIIALSFFQARHSSQGIT